MNKKIVLVLTALLALSAPVCIASNNLEPLDFSDNSSSKQETKQTADNFASSLDTKTKYYSNPSLKSAIQKFKKSNYAGCLQELFSYVQAKPNDAVAYYYMAMSLTHIGDKDAAIKAYERVIAIASDPTLTEYATKGKNCLVYGPTCAPDEEEGVGLKTDTQEPKEEPTQEEMLENFIQSPYGNGLSPELEKQIKEEKLKQIQDTINRKDKLEKNDLEKIRKFDRENSSQLKLNEKIAKADPSDKEILKAIKTLRDAGMNVSIQATPSSGSQEGSVTGATSSSADLQTAVTNPVSPQQVNQQVNPAAAMAGGYTDPQMVQISMMLGNNNNNNNSMMHMLPFLMQQNGQNIDPQVMQAIMMQQMMPSMDFGLNNNNNN